MKKFTALSHAIITLLFLSKSLPVLAEEPQAATNGTPENPVTPTDSTTNESAPVPTPATQSNAEYVIPQPQASRLDALKTSLMLRQLNHQIQTLEANGEPFLTLYRTSMTSDTQGCILLLHSDNEHPDWPDAIAPLRNAMPEYSWCTLSIDVPDIIKRADPIKINTSTSNDASTADNTQPTSAELPNQALVFGRIDAAIAYAKTQNIEQFSFLGYGTGASYALSFLAANQDAGNALILIDIESPANSPSYEMAQKIRQVPQPILDYYVSSTRSDQFAMWRKQAANQRTEKRGDFIQLDALPDRVTGKDSKQLLVQRVRGFLKQNTDQINQQKTLPSVKKGLFYESPINN